MLLLPNPITLFGAARSRLVAVRLRRFCRREQSRSIEPSNAVSEHGSHPEWLVLFAWALAGASTGIFAAVIIDAESGVNSGMMQLHAALGAIIGLAGAIAAAWISRGGYTDR